MLRTYGRLMVDKTLAVVNSCRTPEHLMSAIRYARLADLKNHAQVKIAIISMALHLGINPNTVI